MTPAAIDPHEPIDFGIGSRPPVVTLPDDVRFRLKQRAAQGGFLDADGQPNPLAMMDVAVLEAGDGHLTLAGAKRVLDDTTNPDLAALLRQVMRHIGCKV